MAVSRAVPTVGMALLKLLDRVTTFVQSRDSQGGKFLSGISLSGPQ
jgi:hypothetical protein